jgi:hypothetical protein
LLLSCNSSTGLKISGKRRITKDSSSGRSHQGRAFACPSSRSKRMNKINTVVMIKVARCGKPKAVVLSTVIMELKDTAVSSKSSVIGSNQEVETRLVMASRVEATGTILTA